MYCPGTALIRDLGVYMCVCVGACNFKNTYSHVFVLSACVSVCVEKAYFDDFSLFSHKVEILFQIAQPVRVKLPLHVFNRRYFAW